MTVNELLADSKNQFSLDIFSTKSIAAVEAALTEKNGKYYLKCCARTREVIAKPEEIIRQLWLRRLEYDYGYPLARLVPVTVVGGYPRFQYQGFWFTVVDPWPATWGDGWYYQDNVYIAYTDGGYYLVNPSYPGVELAVNVSM
jgi:hypothetical protein